MDEWSNKEAPDVPSVSSRTVRTSLILGPGRPQVPGLSEPGGRWAQALTTLLSNSIF